MQRSNVDTSIKLTRKLSNMVDFMRSSINILNDISQFITNMTKRYEKKERAHQKTGLV